MAGLKGLENSLCYTSEIHDSILWSEFMKLLNIFFNWFNLILSVPMETVMDELRILSDFFILFLEEATFSLCCLIL